MKKTIKKEWYTDLLENVGLSTTQLIKEKFPEIEFRLLEQKASDLFVMRKIGFFLNNHLLCEASNKLEKNALVNEWISKNPNEPFGSIFKNRNLVRTLVVKNDTGRKYTISGEIHAEIDEKFYKP